MVLRNAFEEMATEATQTDIRDLTQAIRDLIESQQASTERQADLYPLRALQYARDPLDRMRIVVDGGSVYQSGVALWDNGNYRTYYGGTGVFNSIDSRETLAVAYRQQFDAVRHNRWVIT